MPILGRALVSLHIRKLKHTEFNRILQQCHVSETPEEVWNLRRRRLNVSSASLCTIR
jgi:hypothetical protein